MTVKKSQRRKALDVKHTFLFKVDSPIEDGKSSLIKAHAVVRMATKPIDLLLTAAHVKRSIELDGAGNLAKCPGSLCVQANSNLFPHKVEVYVDFSRYRAFVASKRGKTGLPNECYGYEHNGKIPKIVDVKDKIGLKKLLAYIEAHGPIRLRLKPYRKRSEEGRPGRDRSPTGARSNLKGAKLRHALVTLGAVAAA